MAKNKKMTCNKECTDIEMDLTDYVIGDATFLTEERQQKLFEHLRKCADCRNQFWSWKDTLTVLKGREFAERPETKKRMEELINHLKDDTNKLSCRKAPGKNVDIKAKIGAPAGIIWRYLATNGWVSVDELSKETNLDKDIVHEAIGWLGKENKIIMTEEAQKSYVCLAEHERKNAQMQG